MTQKPHSHDSHSAQDAAAGSAGRKNDEEAATVQLGETTLSEPSPLEAAIAERDELRDLLLRTRAEMENIRKRMNRERDDERRYAALPFVRELLPAIDNLHRALAAGQQDANALLQGVEMVTRQLDDILVRHEVKVIPAIGQPFDPNRHEALQQVPTAEYPPMTVIQEYERGFQLHDRVIRPSKVIVSSAPPSA